MKWCELDGWGITTPDQVLDLLDEVERLRKDVTEASKVLWPFADYADTMYVHDDGVMMFGHFTVGQFRDAARLLRRFREEGIITQ